MGAGWGLLPAPVYFRAMTWMGYTAGGLALLAVLLLVSGVSRFRRRRLFSGMSRSGTGLLLLIGSLGAGSLALHLHSYQRLTGEQPVADLVFTQVAPQEYRAVLSQPDAEPLQFLISGDEWQLDARFLKWKGPAVIAGMDPMVRLDRVAGRYRDVNEELSEPRSVYSLVDGQGPDLFRLIHQHPRWVPWVDTVYGSATYMPMGDGARFVITASPSGLVSRPYDESTARLLRDW